jgi:uncharacterized damage-inducible protein DinB
MAANQAEPWLRGTLTDVPAVPRAVLHALELAAEDIEKWCGGLSDEELNARPAGVAPVAFHMRHISRSLDRLLTYAEGRQLTDEQIGAMKAELAPDAKREDLFAELSAALAKSAARVRAMDAARLDELRAVGKRELPTTAGGLLVHVADHTQRHVGHAITTAKIVVAARADSEPRS